MSSLRIISKRRLKEFWTKHPKAKSSLERWYQMTISLHWKNFWEICQTFGSADQTRVASGRTVVIFDIGGNKYRMIAAIHYNIGRIFVLQIMTHAEYDRNRWRNEL